MEKQKGGVGWEEGKLIKLLATFLPTAKCLK